MLNFVYSLIILTSYSIGLSHCHQMFYNDLVNSSQPPSIKDKPCPPWSYYDATVKQCICYDSAGQSIQCTDKGVLSIYSLCVTHDDETGIISSGYCLYFEIQGHNISNEPGHIILPDNVSELNEYMCGPMNRRGLVCSECIEGYGPSVTSLRNRCSNCTNVWYGVLLYFFTEIVPVTIFYVIVLVFQLNLTSAPMTSIVLYSNIIVLANTYSIVATNQTYITLILLLHGVWSLDFIRPIIPPVCISPNLRSIHILYLQNLSTVLPFVYTLAIWILMNVHCSDWKGVKWMCKIVKKIIPKHLNIQRNSGRTIIDAFATFFFLSFFKVTLVLLIPLYPLRIQHISTFNYSSNLTAHPVRDASEDYVSAGQLPFMVLAIGVFLFIIFPTIFIIALYPSKRFRIILLKCCQDRYLCTLNFFLDKFYSCYKDGLNGGKDMRSFASTYFFLVLLAYVLWSFNSHYFLLTALFGGCSLLILIVQPHKKRYITVLESLVLGNLAFLTAVYDRNIYTSNLHQILGGLSVILPILGLTIYIGFRLLKTPCSKLIQEVKEKVPFCESCLRCRVKHSPEGNQVENTDQVNVNIEEEAPLPDRVVRPELYHPTEESVTY